MSGLFKRTRTFKLRGIALLAAILFVAVLPYLGGFAERHRDLLTLLIGAVVFMAVLWVEKKLKRRAAMKPD